MNYLKPMYISPRTAFIRNVFVSLSGGSITLIILLIAPLGLAAVIINTLLVTVAIYGLSSVADRFVFGLPSHSRFQGLSPSRLTNSLNRHRTSNLNRWR